MTLPGIKLASLGVCLAALTMTAATAADAPSAEDLENTSWQLVEIRDLNDSVFAPDDPAKYLLRFRLNSRTEIQADCNKAGASWSMNKNSLTLSRLVTTRKFCPSPSLFNRYIMHLGNVQGLILESERLILQAEPGSVELEFEPYTFVPQF